MRTTLLPSAGIDQAGDDRARTESTRVGFDAPRTDTTRVDRAAMDATRNDATEVAPTAIDPAKGAIDSATPLDLTAFKQAFRRHAAGVAIITALDAYGSPVGFTATSLASLSAVPPLATFNMARSASSWPAIAEAERVVIHMLGVRNRAVAQKLSGNAADRFRGDHWRRGPHGLPILNDVTAWMIGRVEERFIVHNSVVVVAQIEEGGVGENDRPLLYHERQYFQPGDNA